MTEITPAQSEYVNTVADQIQDRLTELFMTYDTKLLATIMMHRSAKALQGLHSLDIWEVEDVRVVVEESIKDIYVRLPQEDIIRVTAKSSGRAN